MPSPTPRVLVLAAALATLLASPSAHAGGPPFLSIESPIDPLDSGAKGAVLVVRAHSCGTEADLAVKGRAEGMVDGRRESIALDLTPTGRPGCRAVRAQWPEKGDWILVFQTTDHLPTTTIVELGPKGGVERATYHGRTVPLVQVRSVRVLDRGPTERDLAELFRPQT